MRHTIKVTQKHIDKAIALQVSGEPICDRCPVALALQDIFPSLHGEFDYDIMAYEGKRTWAGHNYLGVQGKIIDIPRHVSEMIQTWDTYKEMDPFEFEIEVPSE